MSLWGPSLGNPAKRYALYRKYYRVLRHLGVWTHPLYLNEKVAHTILTDVREVMPKWVVTVIFFFLLTPVISYDHELVVGMSEEDSRTRQEYPTKTLNLQASLLNWYITIFNHCMLTLKKLFSYLENTIGCYVILWHIEILAKWRLKWEGWIPEQPHCPCL